MRLPQPAEALLPQPSISYVSCIPPLLLRRAMAGARGIELIVQPGRTRTRERADDVRLARLHIERHIISARPQLAGLIAHFLGPAGIASAHEHVDAHALKRRQTLRRRVVEKTGETGDRPEILRIGRSDQKRG